MKQTKTFFLHSTRGLLPRISAMLILIVLQHPNFSLCITTQSDIAQRYDDAATDPKMQDPDIKRDTMQLVTSKGYTAEWHRVLTRDKYILKMLRITSSPNTKLEGNARFFCSPKNEGRKKPVVLLQHGLMDSSATWVLNSPSQSLGFVLADLGYDVWLGNNRGTSYSMEHAKFSKEWDGWEEEFWDFSWDDMAKYDLPAEIDYLLQVTNADKIAYISHSQGSTQAFAAFSMPEFYRLSEKISIHIAMAPLVFVGHAQSALFQLGGQVKIFRDLVQIPQLKAFGNSFLGAGSRNMMKSMIPNLCSLFLGGCKEGKGDSVHDFFFNTGLMGSIFNLPDMKHLNQSRIPVYLSHIPEGTSVKNLVHWSQAVKSKKFRKYDYGSCNSFNTCVNTIKYGSGKPPQYLLSQYNVPTVLLSGGKDPLANSKDIQTLKKKLSDNDNVLIDAMQIDSYDHNDFTISVNGDAFFFKFLTDNLCEINAQDGQGIAFSMGHKQRGKAGVGEHRQSMYDFLSKSGADVDTIKSMRIIPSLG